MRNLKSVVDHNLDKYLPKVPKNLRHLRQGVLRCGLLLFFSVLIANTQIAHAQNFPDPERDGFDAVKSWSHQRVVEAEQSFLNSRGQHMGSPNFWGAEAVYLIQVDRFNNGDLNNDMLNLPDAQRQGNLSQILEFRHGGDLLGIVKRLDYLVDLGISSLWITPVLKHDGSYHGYCTTDPTQIDPGFGTNEEFRELVKEAHKRGIRVVMDIVVNHLCDPKTTYDVHADHYPCSNDLDHKNWSGQGGGSSAQGMLKFSQNFFKPFRSQFFFNRCGANSLSDMQGTGPSAVYGDFVEGMFDYDTSNYDFQEIFTELHKFWIAYADIDGFRLDASKHITENFVAYFSTHIRDYAYSLGKNNFYLVGEIAGPSDWISRQLGRMYTSPQNPNDHGNVPASLTKRIWEIKDTYLGHPYAKYPGLNGVFAFGQSGTAIEVLQNKRAPSALEAYFKGDYIADLSAQGDYRLNWQNLEIHDWPRFSSYNKHSVEKSILGMASLVFAEGVPVINYGQEQGLNGDCHYHTMNLSGEALEAVKNECHSNSHALYRQDMFMGGMQRLGSTVVEINNLSYIGPISYFEAEKQDPYLNQNHNLYKASRKFLKVRSSCKAIKYGKTQFRWAEQASTEGILAFSRINQNGSDTYEALVVLNTAWSERELPEMKVSDFSSGKSWKNLLNDFQYARTSGNGSLYFSGLKIAANSMMVFVPGDNVSAYNEYLGSHLCIQ